MWLERDFVVADIVGWDQRTLVLYVIELWQWWWWWWVVVVVVVVVVGGGSGGSGGGWW